MFINFFPKPDHAGVGAFVASCNRIFHVCSYLHQVRGGVEATQVAHLALTLCAAVVIWRVAAANVQLCFAKRTVHFRLNRLWCWHRGHCGLLFLWRFLHMSRCFLILLSLQAFLEMARQLLLWHSLLMRHTGLLLLGWCMRSTHSGSSCLALLIRASHLAGHMRARHLTWLLRSTHLTHLGRSTHLAWGMWATPLAWGMWATHLGLGMWATHLALDMWATHLALGLWATHLAWGMWATHGSWSMGTTHTKGFGERGSLLLLLIVRSCIAEHHLASCWAWLGCSSGKRINIYQGTCLIEQRCPKTKQFRQPILSRRRALTLRPVDWGGASTPSLVVMSCHGLMHRRAATQIRLGRSLCQARERHSAGVWDPWSSRLVWACNWSWSFLGV